MLGGPGWEPGVWAGLLAFPAEDPESPLRGGSTFGDPAPIPPADGPPPSLSSAARAPASVFPSVLWRAGDQVTGMGAWPRAAEADDLDRSPERFPHCLAGSWDLAWGHAHFPRPEAPGER